MKNNNDYNNYNYKNYKDELSVYRINVSTMLNVSTMQNVSTSTMLNVLCNNPSPIDPN